MEHRNRSLDEAQRPGGHAAPSAQIDRFVRFDQTSLILLLTAGCPMQTFTANEAKTRFGELLDRVQRAPVQVTRHNRVVGVMVSVEDYEAMRRFYADRLRKTLRDTADEAAAAGLTEEKLAQLLADKS